MTNFERYTALLERTLAGWRNVVRVDNVDGVLFGFKDYGDVWEYTFSIRINKEWTPIKKKHKPVDMDAYAWDIESEPPINQATKFAMEILSDMQRIVEVNNEAV